MVGKINKNSTSISGSINAPTPSTGTVSRLGGGTADHTKLLNRNAPNQHNIAAITGLQDLLDSKLDSETALPLIEDATNNKARGLFYDIHCEIAEKPYWYLTSEIDEETGQGTLDSIISGPYDLGQGGGGGGGGGGVTDVTLNIAIDPETGERMWPTYVAIGSACTIGVTWSSTRDGESTGRGTLYVYVNDKLVETKATQQGIVTFEIGDYLTSGENKIEIRAIDAYSTSKNFISSISGITLKLQSNFEDDISYTGDVTFTYIPTGNIRKLVYFIVDGVQFGAPEVVTTSGEQWTKIIPQSLLTHGSHTLEVYFTCELDGETVRSNELYYDLICYEPGNTTPIIASTFKDSAPQEQYVSFTVRYRVFTPNKNDSIVYLISDGTSSSPLTIDQRYHLWECRFDIPGNHTLIIRTGRVSKIFNVKVVESTVHVEPVTQSLALELSSYGRSNSVPLEERSQWNYNDITSTLTGFNWVSNGWVLDDDGNTALRLSGDARVTINYKPFETDFTSTGKTFEFEIATSDVKDYETKIFECLDGADTITYSTRYAGEDTRTKKFAVESIDLEMFTTKVLGSKGTYVFIYDGHNWDLDGLLVTQEALRDEYGITLEEVDLDPTVIEPSHYVIEDKITVYYTVAGHGFYITPQLAKLQSNQSSLSTQYKEGEKVRLAFVVENRNDGSETFKTRLLYMYINGILSGVSRYPEGDSFQQTPASKVANITIGSNDATVDVYTIRIYNSNLTRKQIVQNWIADTRNPVLKAQRYKHNDNYNDENKISLDKVKLLGNLPYMILRGEKLPAYKKDRKYIEVEYRNPSDPDRDFTATQARADVQGTSSQYYYRKNFKIKFEGGFEDNNGNWTEHYKMRGDDSKKEKTYTFKADVASSEGANNVELVRYFEDTKNWYSPAEQEPDTDLNTADSKLRIRVGIDGFPIVMFHDAGDNKPVFYGKMNFNNDKGNERTFGFKEGDECWEFVNNSSPLVLFKTDDLTDWQSSWESRYPEEYGDDAHAYGTGPGELTKLQQVVSWIVSTRRDTATGNPLPTRKSFDGGVTYYTHDTEEYRLAKFKGELSQYFDKTSSLFYYLYTELFLMVDSRAKNAMLAYLKSRQPGDGGNKWFWMPYDMDTALGINNEGLLVFSYDKEDTDLQEGANIYNGQASIFWNNLRDAFGPELKQMYADLRTDKGQGKPYWSYDNIEKYFEDHQAVWSEAIFNEDAYTKYLEPYINDKDATYLGMAQGSKEQQRKWWMYNRFKYLDSKYLTGDALKDTIMFRAYVPVGPKPNITVTPYQNMYAAALFRNGDTVTPVRASKGTPVTLVNTVEYEATETDQETIIYSASQLKDIGDLSVFKPGYADFSKATKLQRLQIGSSNPSYENPNLKGINVGANHLLTYLDARHCKNLGVGEGADVTPTIDLSQCYSIEEAYFDDTQIKAVSFPVGGNLKRVHLPETITSLTIRNHPNLEELVLGGTANLSSIWLEDIPSTTINAVDIISQMPDGSTVRLMNINNTINTVGEVEAFYAKLARMQGRDGKGDPTPKAQITGVIHVPQTVNFPYAIWKRLSEQFDEVTIDAKVVCTVNFWNEGVLHESKLAVLGGPAQTPSIPVKASTQQYYYTFAAWDQAYDEVFEDLDINATFDPHIQHYTIKFRTGSNLIHAIPAEVDLEYGALIPEPTLDYGTVDETTIRFLGWYTANNDQVDFTTKTVSGNIIRFPETMEIVISARWQDMNAPLVERITVLAYNKFRFELSDNLGVTGYAITNSAEAPAFEDSAWVNLPEPLTYYSNEYTVRHAGEYYVHVKDDTSSSFEKVTAYAISLTQNINNEEYDTSENIVQLALTENDEPVNASFALQTTTLVVATDLDEHYESLSLYCNDVFVDTGTSLYVAEDLNFVATCYPKHYMVTFDVGDHGSNVDSQEIIYKHFAIEPTPQVDGSMILDNWSYEDNIWVFNSYAVLGDMELVANWVNYTGSTDIQLDLPVGNLFPSEGIEVSIHIYQSVGRAVQIRWEGDSTDPSNISRLNVEGDTTFTHRYMTGGGHAVKISRLAGDFILGKSYDYPLVEPIEYVSDITFGYDIAATKEGLLRGAINLYDIKLNRFMVTLASSMFEGCTNIRHVIIAGENSLGELDLSQTDMIPESVRFIGDNVFKGCTALVNIRMPERLASLGTNVFADCTGLQTVTFSDNSTLSTLPNNTFSGCSDLISVHIPNSITTVGEYAFNGCSSLANIVLGPNVVRIGASAFADCTILNDVAIRATSMESMGLNIFYNCPNLQDAGPIGGDYDIKFGWQTAIPANAFGVSYTGASALLAIDLPNTITSIGDRAFYRCTRLQAVNSNNILPRSLIYIGDESFRYCFELLGIDIPASTTYIGASAFDSCRGLRTIYIRCPNSTYKVTATTGAWFAQVSLSIFDPSAEEWGGELIHIPSALSDTDPEKQTPSEAYGEFWNWHSQEIDSETGTITTYTLGYECNL